jgi:hypothetical protein
VREREREGMRGCERVGGKLRKRKINAVRDREMRAKRKREKGKEEERERERERENAKKKMWKQT